MASELQSEEVTGCIYLGQERMWEYLCRSYWARKTSKAAGSPESICTSITHSLPLVMIMGFLHHTRASNPLMTESCSELHVMDDERLAGRLSSKQEPSQMKLICPICYQVD